jgi:hypothetical protein
MLLTISLSLAWLQHQNLTAKNLRDQVPRTTGSNAAAARRFFLGR